MAKVKVQRNTPKVGFGAGGEICNNYAGNSARLRTGAEIGRGRGIGKGGAGMRSAGLGVRRFGPGGGRVVCCLLASSCVARERAR